MSSISRTSPDKLFSAALVIGVEKERVDPYTLWVIDQLFPGHHGIEFVARFLRFASAKQLALPELAIEGGADVAVVTAQSLRALAKLIGWSYDTVEKYVVVMSQLHLLLKRRCRHQIELHFPLCRCQLPKPEALDRIQELRPGKLAPRYRVKVRSFADQVKRRFVLLCKGNETELTLSSPVATPVDRTHAAPQLMEDIHLILQQEVDSQKVDSGTASRLYLKIEEILRYHCAQSRLSERNGDSFGEGYSSEESESPFGREKGDSADILSYEQSRLSVGKDDSLGTLSASQSRLLLKKGNSALSRRAPDEQESSSCRPKGDFFEQQEAGQVGESPFWSEKGDSANTLVSTYNVRNTSFLKQEDSTNVQRELAEELAVCVEGHAGNSNQYERYLASTDSRLVLATYLYVLEEVWSKQRTPQPVKVPGAYFHTMLTAWKKFTSYEAACQAYIDAYGELQAKGKTPAPRDRLPGIPTRLQGLVENLHGWSYADARDELAVLTQRRKTGSTAAFLPTQHAPSDEQEDVLEPEEIPSRWMTTETEAKALIERIRAEAPIVGSHVEQLRVRPYRVRGNGNVVYVVDALVERVPQVYAAPSQWEEYFVPLKQDLEEEQCKSTEHEA